MATECTREWTDFFIGSGIPVDVASSYALIFYENRIQKNMLLDLNKEYLTDMGITVMGDVIAILRYAKVIHKKYVSEKILVEQSKETAPDHEKSTGGNVSKTAPIKKSEVNMQLNDVEMKSSQDRKLRNIVPEYKGNYNIKIPKVIGEKCRRISEQMPRKREMKTVFERLGESSVSSTTSEILPTNSPISSNSSSLHKEKNISVFSRLGEKTTSVVSSTSSPSESGESKFNLAIFKSTSIHKKATMRADDEQHKNIVKKSEAIKKEGGGGGGKVSSSLSSSSSSSIKNRLGILMSEGKQNFSAKKIIDDKETRSNNKSFDGDSNDGENKKKCVKNPLNNNTGVPMLKKATLTSAQIQRLETAKGMGRKRKMNSELIDPEGNSFCKKVRFGSTTLRLIPSFKTANTVKQSSHIEIMGNRRKPGLKIRSLKESIGERMNTRHTEGFIAKKRNRSIRDRLG